MEYENEFLDELKEIRSAIRSLKSDELQEQENVGAQIKTQRKLNQDLINSQEQYNLKFIEIHKEMLKVQRKYNSKFLKEQKILVYWTMGLTSLSFILAAIGIVSLLISY